MSSFEDINADELLRALALEMGETALQPQDEDMRVGMFDGRPMLLNAWDGEDLRCAMVGEYAQVQYDRMVNSSLHRGEADEGGQLLDALYQAMQQFRSGGMAGRMLAAEGDDYVRLPDVTPGTYGARRLKVTQRLFGIIEGSAFGGFVTINPGGLSEEGTRTILPKPAECRGAMLVLKDVAICDASPEGDGEKLDTYEEACLPIHANGLTWFTARPK